MNIKKILIPNEIKKNLKSYEEDLRKALFIQEKVLRSSAVEDIEKKIIEELLNRYPEYEIEVKVALNEFEKEIVKKRTVIEGKRMDGRSFRDIRPIWCEISVLPELMVQLYLPEEKPRHCV